MRRLMLVALSLMMLAASAAFAADAAERMFIREGMSEGEVLLKIGKPDSEKHRQRWRCGRNREAVDLFADIGRSTDVNNDHDS